MKLKAFEKTLSLAIPLLQIELLSSDRTPVKILFTSLFMPVTKAFVQMAYCTVYCTVCG